MKNPTLLNVGGGSKAIPLPDVYAGFTHVLLDIDPRSGADMLCDARNLCDDISGDQFDAVYCSHNLEHYYAHDVKRVLSGFLHVLRQGGFVHIRVPDIMEVMRLAVAGKLDIESVLYQSPAGPISVVDVLYGQRKQVEESGCDFMSHKTGFSQKSLMSALLGAGFQVVYSGTGNLEVACIAFKGEPSDKHLELLKLKKA